MNTQTVTQVPAQPSPISPAHTPLRGRNTRREWDSNLLRARRITGKTYRSQRMRAAWFRRLRTTARGRARKGHDRRSDHLERREWDSNLLRARRITGKTYRHPADASRLVLEAVAPRHEVGPEKGTTDVTTTLRGGSGIRTHGTGYPAQRFSRPSPSSARPSLQERPNPHSASVSQGLRVRTDYGLLPNASRSDPRRGWDLNPRDRKPGPTVFETVTFVRSVTPPEPARPAILGTEY